LGVECKMGGNYHPTLNITKRPIAYKYREGKLKKHSGRRVKIPEIAMVEACAIFCMAVIFSQSYLNILAS
jgi:hypothetical protein